MKRKRDDKRCLAEVTRNAVEADLRMHRSYAFIEKEHRVSVHTVSKIAKSMGHDYVPRTTGNKPAIGDRTERLYMRTLVSGGMKSIPMMQKQLKDAYGVTIKSTALRDMVKRHGMRYYSRKKRPLLNKAQKLKRLAWCEKYKDYTSEDWESAVFADETQVKLYEPKIHAGHWRLPGALYASSDFLPVQTAASGNVMIWGAISRDGPEPLCEVNGTMNKELYQDILKKHLVSYFYDLEDKYGEMLYIDDNDPKHNADLVTIFKEQKGIRSIEFPPRSPELNPIENVWSMLHYRVFQNVPLFTARSEIFALVEEQWRAIAADTVLSLIHSLPKRICLVIEAKGGNISKY
jgi:transposase